MRHWWLSSRIATYWVETDGNGIILDAAPIARKWRGRNIVDLIKWTHVDRYEEI